MKIISIAFIVLFFISSCATHEGTISSSPIHGNVKYEDIAFGITQSNKFFGIGGLTQDALVLDAKRNMISNRPLKSNEEYANYTIDFKRTYILFYFQTKVTVSADVVKYFNDTLCDPYSDVYLSKIKIKKFSNDLFHVGDSVIDNNLNESIIISFENEDLVKLLYIDKLNHVKTVTEYVNNIYTKLKSFKGFNVGDYCVEVIKDSDTERQVNVKVLCVGLNSVLIKDSNGVIRPIKSRK